MPTISHVTLHVEAIVYEHVSDESSWYLQKSVYKVMNILLQAKWQVRSRNKAGIQDLPVPMHFIQILSYKDEVWEQQHNKKDAAADHQVLCTHSDVILDASFQTVWLPCYLKYLRVDLDICKATCRRNQEQGRLIQSWGWGWGAKLPFSKTRWWAVRKQVGNLLLEVLSKKVL